MPILNVLSTKSKQIENDTNFTRYAMSRFALARQNGDFSTKTNVYEKHSHFSILYIINDTHIKRFVNHKKIYYFLKMIVIKTLCIYLPYMLGSRMWRLSLRLLKVYFERNKINFVYGFSSDRKKLLHLISIAVLCVSIWCVQEIENIENWTRNP